MRPPAKQLRMTRMHFEAIAAVLKSEKPIFAAGQSAYAQWFRMVEKFARMCADSDPNFRAPQFYLACGLEG